MDTITLVLISILVILLIYWITQRKNGPTPPGPMGLPIVGYMLFLTKKPHLHMQKLAKIYGPIYSLRLGSHYAVVLDDFYSMKDAFAQDAFMGRPPDSPMDMNKETLETEAFNGLPWREQRRFSLHMLRDLGFGKPRMEELIKEEIQELLLHIERSGGKPMLLRSLLAPSMSNNIATLVFGKRLKYDDPVRVMFDRTLKEGVEAADKIGWTLFFPWIKNVLKFFKIGDIDRLKKINKEMRDYISKEIEEHESTLDDQNIRDFIDGYLLEIRKRNDPAFCKEVLQDLVFAFFMAGSETVRVTVDWLLLTMAAIQDVQRKVQAEIDDVLNHRHVTWNDHLSMPYTEAVISEVMRWRPIIPINILRYTLTDAELNDFIIPKQSWVITNIWSFHHNPQYWGRDAEEFRPERFLLNDGKQLVKSEYFIPFSIGKRACPGKPLAKVETFLYFVSILQNFSITLPEGQMADLEGEMGMALMPKKQELCFVRRE